MKLTLRTCWLVMLLRLRGQPPHHHVVLYALAQRCDRTVSWENSHGKSLQFKGTPWFEGDSTPLKARKYTAQSTYATLSRSEFVGQSLGTAAGAGREDQDGRVKAKRLCGHYVRVYRSVLRA